MDRTAPELPIPSSGSNAATIPIMQMPTNRGRVTVATVPWLLILLLGAMVYPVYYQMNGPSMPYEETTLAGVVEQTQSGDMIGRVIIVTLGLIGISLLFRNRAKIRLQPMIANIVFAFLAWSGLSLLWSVDPSLTGRRVISLALMTLFAAGCVVRMTGFSLPIFITSVPIFSIVAGVPFELAHGRFQPFTAEYRFCGMAPHPNVEGAYLSVAVILLCWQSWQARGIPRVRFIIAALIVILFLMLTGSRTSLLAVCAALGFSFMLIVVRNAKWAVAILIASFSLTIVAASLLDSAILNELGDSPLTITLQRDGQGYNSSAFNGRGDLWRSLLPYVAKRPWIGYGYGAFWSPERIEVVTMDQGWVIQQSHSAYLDQLLALGIPGALLYIILLILGIGWSAVQFTRHRDDYGAWAAVLVFISIHNLTESISAFTSFTNLVFYVVVLHLAFTRQDRSNGSVRMAA